MSPVAPKIKITMEKPKSKRTIGKLAQARRAKKAQEEVVDLTPLIFKAMDALPGYAYPRMGSMLKLAGGQFTMSREFVSARPGVVQKIKLLDQKAALSSAKATKPGLPSYKVNISLSQLVEEALNSKAKEDDF